MALAIDASTPAYVSSVATVSAFTTASFTPPLGALLVVAHANSAGAILQTAPTNTGGAVTWDAAAKITEAANTCAASIWLGTVTTSASMTVTAHQGTATSDWAVGVVVVTGQAATQNGVTGVATSASGLPSKSVTTVGANSLILASITNFSNGTGPTIPADQSDSFNAHTFLFQDAANAATWAQYLTGMNLAAGATATINDTAPTVDYSMVMLEILAAATATAATPFIPQRMPLGC